MSAEGKREFRNRVLMDLLTTGPVPDFRWTAHAKNRIRELVAQGFSPRHLGGISDGSATVGWGGGHGSPVLRYREWAVPLEVTADGEVVAVTALPSSRSAWETVLSSGLIAEGREEIRI